MPLAAVSIPIIKLTPLLTQLLDSAGLCAGHLVYVGMVCE